jgi:hypothetical protein
MFIGYFDVFNGSKAAILSQCDLLPVVHKQPTLRPSLGNSARGQGPDKQIASNARRLGPLRCHRSKNLVSYLGVDCMAEEWWSTISQRSPLLT